MMPGAEAPELLLLASVRDGAVAVLREMHMMRRAAPEVITERPEYWLGRLEGVALALVASADLVMEAKQESEKALEGELA